MNIAFSPPCVSHAASNYAVDTSAAMIAASGLIELGQWTGDATYTNAVSGIMV